MYAPFESRRIYAVSYTHLDVYKRQDNFFGEERLLYVPYSEALAATVTASFNLGSAQPVSSGILLFTEDTSAERREEIRKELSLSLIHISSDLILADDNFATIVSAVRQGRGIYENIKRTVHFPVSYTHLDVYKRQLQSCNS